MPRNGSGSYLVPTSFSPDTDILSGEVNENFTDVGTALTGSLALDGQSSMTGQFKAASGTAAAPGISFGSDTDSGLYRASGDTIGVSVAGANVATITASGIALASGATLTDSNGDSPTVMPTGAMIDYLVTTAPTGWVRANGRTIGDASSGSSERANADTEDLFTLLWTNFSNSILAILDSAGSASTRGVSAAADFAAHKRMPLPDLRGRVAAGLDDMGNSAASRLTSTTMTPDGTSNGASGGTQTHTLTEAELAVHDHANSLTDPGHVHTEEGVSTNSIDGGSGSGLRVTSVDTNNTGSATTGITITNADAGSGTAHNNTQPTWLVTKIIKL